ncbi:hypothetical protein CW304_12485 [Bacillus sp. UFRGS-B20]|nr:hypothetical protein CW304_12485 [Bacillus sp. UFRGS-B20]
MSGCSKNARILSSVFDEAIPINLSRRFCFPFFFGFGFEELHLIFFQYGLIKMVTRFSLFQLFCRIPCIAFLDATLALEIACICCAIFGPVLYNSLQIS